MDSELIKHMAQKLRDDELPYQEGAWERFEQRDSKKRSTIWWPYWSAVAVILLALGVLLGYNFGRESAQKTLVAAVQKKPIMPKPLGDKPIPEQSRVFGKTDKALDSISTQAKQSKVGSTVGYHQLLKSSVLENLKTSNLYAAGTKINLALQKQVLPSFEKTASVDTSNARKLTFEEILARDSKTAPENTEKKQRERLRPDIYIASTMGNDQKLNLNYGFSLSYPIAKKISISSGVAYTAMSSTQESGITDRNAPSDAAPVSMAFAAKSPVQTSKTLSSVNARVIGLSFPLDVRYQLNNRVYAGVGVAAVTVLKNNQQNNYNVIEVQNTTYANTNGVAENRPLIVSSTQTETQPEGIAQSQRFLGFYNFSLGYRQQLSPKSNIGLEPFLRVPMQGFSKDNLNLTHGGLRLKFDF